jgi:NADH:ubiquinone oxidoreductase subunit E
VKKCARPHAELRPDPGRARHRPHHGGHDPAPERLLGPKLRTRRKLETYESGVPLIDASHKRLSIQFFVIAMVFILFDVEIAFLYPWALVFKDGRLAALRRDVSLPGDPGGRLRLHLEEGSASTGEPHPLSRRGAGEPRTFPPEAMARIEKILSATRPSRRALFRPLGRAGDLGLDLEGGGRGGRADPGAAASHVDGVLTFYTMYNLRPSASTSADLHVDLLPPRRRGALVEHCARRLGIGLEETTRDGKFTLVEVECIAGCDRAPSMMVNDTYHEPMDEKKLDALLDGSRREPDVERVLTRRVGRADSQRDRGLRPGRRLRRRQEGLRGLDARAADRGGQEVGLRGRGGAGFPTGVKWGFVPRTRRASPSTCSATPTNPSPARSRTGS